MSENERDSHFLGFAKLLIHDLNTVGFDENGYRSAEGTQKVIAQHAYDLALHTVKNIANVTGPPELAFVDIWGMMEHYTEIVVADTPDLTKWPDH